MKSSVYLTIDRTGRRFQSFDRINPMVVQFFLLHTAGWITAIKARGEKVKHRCIRLRRHRRLRTRGPGRPAHPPLRVRCPAGAPWEVCPISGASLAPVFANDNIQGQMCTMMTIETVFFLFPVPPLTLLESDKTRACVRSMRGRCILYKKRRWLFYSIKFAL